MYKKIISAGFFLCCFNYGFCQNPKITEVDAEIIKSKARELVGDKLNLCYNLIASPLEKSQIANVIKGACTETNKQIFEPSAQIADDVDPENTVQKPSVDMDVKTYLDNLDVYYQKNENEDYSIELIPQKVSNIKRRDANTYLKVYFISYFKSKHKDKAIPYLSNNRVAEILIHKQDQYWKTTIASIDFYKPADTINDIENNIQLDRDTSLNSIDSAARSRINAMEMQHKKEEEDKTVEEEQKKMEQYQALLKKGDDERANKEYGKAIEFYLKASDIIGYDKGASMRILATRADQYKSQRAKAVVFDEYLETARKAKNRRDRKTALDYYRKARDIDDAKALSFATEYNTLDKQNEELDKMEEKYNSGLYKEAIDDYSAILKKNKDNIGKEFSDYFNGRGMCYERMQQNEKAEKDYSKAIELDRDNVQAYVNRSSLYRKTGRYIDAISDKKQARDKDPDNPLNYLELAELRLLDNKPFKDAIQELEKGLREESLKKNAQLYLRKGQLLFMDKQVRQSIDDFTTVVQLEPGNPLGYYNRGLALIQQNNTDAAAKDFETARNSGLDTASRAAVAKIAFDYMAQSVREVNTHADSALIHVSNAIAIDPSNAQYKFEKGLYLFNIGNYNEAINFFSQCLTLNSSHGDAYFKRGVSYHKTGEHKKAEEDLTHASQIIAGNYEIIKSLADAQSSLKDFANASVRYEQAIKLSEKLKGIDIIVAEMNDSLGKAYFQLKNYNGAVDAFKSAIRKKENFADAYFNRGLAYHFQGMQEAAMPDLSTAISLDNKTPEWYFYAGKAHYAGGKNNEAIGYFSSLIKLDTGSQFKDAFYYRGRSYMLLEMYDAALKDYQTVEDLKIDSSFKSFNYEFGLIYLNSKQLDNALSYFRKQSKTDSSNIDLNYAMGMAFAAKGQIDDALPYLNTVLGSKTVSPKKMRSNKFIAAIADDKRVKDLLKKY